MKTSMAIGILFLAAILEAGGDALVRSALHSPAGSARKGGLFLLGAVVLFAYGCVVNAPNWDFGRLLGIYVVFFFVVAQLIGWLAFHQTPAPAVLFGGALIVAGGVVISVFQ
jgi:drug/metabolite transporter (DMT)-like permease